MMDNFAKILRCLLTSDAYTSGGVTTTFNIQINFDIPIFEGQIDVDALDKWLNLIEGYLFGHNFCDREKITFLLLKVIPHVKYLWETFYEKKGIEGSTLFVVAPT
jgi:hypothetical protein